MMSEKVSTMLCEKLHDNASEQFSKLVGKVSSSLAQYIPCDGTQDPTVKVGNEFVQQCVPASDMAPVAGPLESQMRFEQTISRNASGDDLFSSPMIVDLQRTFPLA